MDGTDISEAESVAGSGTSDKQASPLIQKDAPPAQHPQIDKVKQSDGPTPTTTPNSPGLRRRKKNTPPPSPTRSSSNVHSGAAAEVQLSPRTPATPPSPGKPGTPEAPGTPRTDYERGPISPRTPEVAPRSPDKTLPYVAITITAGGDNEDNAQGVSNPQSVATETRHGLRLLPSTVYDLNTATSSSLCAFPSKPQLAVFIMGGFFQAPYAVLAKEFARQHPEFGLWPVVAAAICNFPYPTAFLSASLPSKNVRSALTLVLGSVSAYFLADSINEDLSDYPDWLFWSTYFPIRLALHFTWLDSSFRNGLVPQTSKPWLKILLSAGFFPVAVLMNTMPLSDAAGTVGTWNAEKSLRDNITNNPGSACAGFILSLPTSLFTMMALMRAGFTLSKAVLSLKNFCTKDSREFARVRSDSADGESNAIGEGASRLQIVLYLPVAALAALSASSAFANASDEIKDGWLVLLISAGALVCNIFYTAGQVPHVANKLSQVYNSCTTLLRRVSVFGSGSEPKHKITPTHANAVLEV